MTVCREQERRFAMGTGIMNTFDMTGMEITGYIPGVVGRITELHATYYYEQWGFDVSFETQVGRELSGFIGEFQGTRDGFWVARVNGEFAASAAIDGRTAESEGVRLRWFIVEPRFQGRGIGRTLLGEAVEFCRKAGCRKAYLWTFEGLHVARALYEEHGFILSEEHSINQWGRVIREQKFVLPLD